MLITKTIRFTEKLFNAASKLMSARVLSAFVSLSALMGTTHCAGSFPGDSKASSFVLFYGLIKQCGNVSYTGVSFLPSSTPVGSNKLNFYFRSMNTFCNEVSDLGNTQQNISVNGNNNLSGNLIAAGNGIFRVEVQNNGYYLLGQTNVPYTFNMNTTNAGNASQSGTFNAKYAVPVFKSITPANGSVNVDPHNAIRSRFQVDGISDATSLPLGGYTIVAATINGLDASSTVTYEAAAQNASIPDNELDVVMQNIHGASQWYAGYGIAVNAVKNITHVGLGGSLISNTAYSTTADTRPVPTFNLAVPPNGYNGAPVPFIDTNFNTGSAGQAANLRLRITHTVPPVSVCVGSWNYTTPNAQLVLSDLGGGLYQLRYTPINGAGASAGNTCATSTHQTTVQVLDGPLSPVQPVTFATQSFSSP